MVRDRGAQFLDAPFTGSKSAADARELVYFIGGSDKTLQIAEPVLKASSKAIVKIGKIGDAATVKIATNLISAVTVQALAEAYAIVKGSGIDPLALSEALKHHAIRSGVTDAKLAKILDQQYEPHFSLKNMFKDVQLGIHIANSLEIDIPATTSTAGVMYGGLTKGWAEEDFSVMARSYQKEEAPQQQPLAVTGPASGPPGGNTPAGPDRTFESPALLALAQKREPPRESTPEELRNVGVIMPEPATENAVEAKTDAPLAGAPAEKGKDAESPKEAGAAVAEAGRPHTPFVRIRRWFGTGSPN
jgi:hypothetical protein